MNDLLEDVMLTNVKRGFHWQHGWYFQRRDDGSVQMAHVVNDHEGEHVGDLKIIPALEWASIMVAVSNRPATADAYEAAKSFHGTP